MRDGEGDFVEVHIFCLDEIFFVSFDGFNYPHKNS